MKKLMICLIMCCSIHLLQAQGIRKEWHEMTPNEKLSLMEAIKYAQSQEGIFYKMGFFHGQRFNDIHFNARQDMIDGENGLGDFLVDQFGPWHRWAIFTVERDLQEFQPELSMPFWDWTIYNTKSDEMWSPQHLGQFDNIANWFQSLGRSAFASSNILPSASDVDFVLSQSDWYYFVYHLEGGNQFGINGTQPTNDVHPGGHGWTGGIMGDVESPWDPVFFLHHNTIDKIWQEWEDNGGTSSFNLPLVSNDLNGDNHYLWPEDIDPDDISDSKSFGVFFAENQNADLNNYSVSNLHRDNEVFFYQYMITAGNNFVVPQDKTAEIISYNSIKLSDGFQAQDGSDFQARIGNESVFDLNCSCDATQPLPAGGRIALNETRRVNAYENPYEDVLSEKDFEVTIYPNPSNGNFLIKAASSAQVKVYTVDGKLVQDIGTVEKSKYVESSNLTPGLYHIVFETNDQVISEKLVIKK